MRRTPVPGATGTQTGSRQVEPSTPRKRRSSPSDQRRRESRQRMQLEAAEQAVRDIRNEREPLARRHLGADAHVDPVELPARDWTRASRVESVQADVDHGFAVKRGERTKERGPE